MCRICTQPWAEGVGECMVGENGLRYHSTSCYQQYLDGIAKVSPLIIIFIFPYKMIQREGEILFLPFDSYSNVFLYTTLFVEIY